MKTPSGIVVHLLVVFYARMMLSDEDHRAQRWCRPSYVCPLCTGTGQRCQQLQRDTDQKSREVANTGPYVPLQQNASLLSEPVLPDAGKVYASQNIPQNPSLPSTPLYLYTETSSTEYFTKIYTWERGEICLTTQERRERELHSASSLEEVLRLTNSPDWKLWKCRLKLKRLQPSPNRESYRSSPAGSHRSTRFAATSYSREPGQEITQEILQDIDEEWQKIQCVPRDMCVDVAKELGTNLGVFFKPPCVSVFRCNGCCNNEGVTCRNTSTTYVNKTLLMVIPFNNKPEPVLIKVANHTECNCMEPALIRRHARPHRRNGCPLVQRTAGLKGPRNLCASGLIWDCMADQCIPYPSRNQEFSPSARMPECEIDVDRCDCVPRNITRPLYRCYLNSSICASDDKDFDQVFCRCK